MTDSKIEKLANAVIAWLSEFPFSQISPEYTFEDLFKPLILFHILDLLLDQDDINAAIVENWNPSIHDGEEDITIPSKVLTQIFNLDRSLHHHLTGKTDLNLTPHINFYQLILRQDKQELEKLCLIVLDIGTYTSKLSSHGLTYLQFLSKDDKEIIDEYRDKSRNRDFELTDHKIVSPFDSNFDDFNKSNETFFCIEEDDWRATQWENAMFDSVIYRIAKEKS